MSKFNHTPWPWIVEGIGIHALVRSGINGVIVAVRHRVSAREHEANARLIAAAPDLLDALQLARRMCGLKGEVHRVIDAAIAKATGGEG